MSNSEQIIVAERLINAIAKLQHEVERMRNDIAKLHGRIEPFENEKFRPDPSYSGIKTMREALEAIEFSRESIRTSEYHFNAIRGAIDGISSDAISRAEMKPWLKG